MKVILFFINFKKKSSLFEKPKNNKSAQSAINKVSRLKQIYKNLMKI